MKVEKSDKMMGKEKRSGGRRDERIFGRFTRCSMQISPNRKEPPIVANTKRKEVGRVVAGLTRKEHEARSQKWERASISIQRSVCITAQEMGKSEEAKKGDRSKRK